MHRWTRRCVSITSKLYAVSSWCSRRWISSETRSAKGCEVSGRSLSPCAPFGSPGDGEQKYCQASAPPACAMPYETSRACLPKRTALTPAPATRGGGPQKKPSAASSTSWADMTEVEDASGAAVASSSALDPTAPSFTAPAVVSKEKKDKKEKTKPGAIETTVASYVATAGALVMYDRLVKRLRDGAYDAKSDE